VIVAFIINLIFLLLLHNHYHSSSPRENHIIFFFILFYVAIYSFLPATNFLGPDHKQYIKIFDAIPSAVDFLIYGENLSNTHGGILWTAIVSIIKSVFNDSHIVLFIIISLSIAIKVAVLKKHVNYYYVAVFIYMCHEVFLKEWIQVRNGLAVSIIMVSFFYLAKNAWLKSFGAFSMALLIHKIVIVFFPVYILAKLKNWGVNLLILLLPVNFIILQTGFPDLVLTIIANYVAEVQGYLRWDSYREISLSLAHPTLIKYYLLVTFFYFFRNKLSADPLFYPLLSVYVLSLHYFLFFSYFALFAGRAGGSLYFVEAILLSILVSRYKNKKIAMIGILSYGTLLTFYNFLVMR